MTFNKRDPVYEDYLLIHLKGKKFHNDIGKSEFICPLVSKFIVNIVIALVDIAPSCSTVKGHVEVSISVHWARDKVRNIIIWVLDRFMQK